MKNFIVIFREPDGRVTKHAEEDMKQHQKNWNEWFGKWSGEGRLTGGSGLTLSGKLLKGRPLQVSDEIHKVGTEIVGGFLLLKADDLDEATEIVKSCPIFEFDGYAEIREIQR